MPYTPGAVGSQHPAAERGAIHIEGDWWRLIGLEIIHGPYGVFGLDTNNNVYDRLVTRDNYESGLHLQGASSNNQILNLDSYGNRDPRNNGESADGLAIKEGSGTGNVVRGARLWNNSDDGLDFWMFPSPILVENSLAWGNGFNRWNLPGLHRRRQRFQARRRQRRLPASHTVRNSMAWDNAVGGFIDNDNPGQHDDRPQHRVGQPGTGFDFDRSDSTLTRNLAVANGTTVSLGRELQRHRQLLGPRRHAGRSRAPTRAPSPGRGPRTARSRPRPSCGPATAPTWRPLLEFSGVDGTGFSPVPPACGYPPASRICARGLGDEHVRGMISSVRRRPAKPEPVPSILVPM